jgi:hypothetical protein
MNPDEERQRREFRRIGALGSSAVWRAKEKKAREWRRRRTIGAFVSHASTCAETAIPSLSDCGRQSAPHRRCVQSGRSPVGAGWEDGGDGGGAAGYVEAAVDVLKVCADGGLGDGQVSSNLPVV